MDKRQDEPGDVSGTGDADGRGGFRRFDEPLSTWEDVCSGPQCLSTSAARNLFLLFHTRHDAVCNCAVYRRNREHLIVCAMFSCHHSHVWWRLLERCHHTSCSARATLVQSMGSSSPLGQWPTFSVLCWSITFVNTTSRTVFQRRRSRTPRCTLWPGCLSWASSVTCMSVRFTSAPSHAIGKP